MVAERARLTNSQGELQRVASSIPADYSSLGKCIGSFHIDFF